MEQVLASDWLGAASEASDWSRSDPVRWSMCLESWANLILVGLVKYNLYLKMPEMLSFFTGLLRLFDIKVRVDLFWQTSWVFVFSGCEPHHRLTATLSILSWNIETSRKVCSKNIYFRILAVIAVWLIINLPLYYKNDQMTTIISPFYPWLCWNLKNSLPRTML